ncbi:MAG: hypothetical protein Q4G68_03605 [Planctomycetia bacterium]|nr:hypothetical protein [Planctomycetia bacterium]
MKKYFAILLTFLASVFLGCGSNSLPDGMPPLKPFDITITQEGAPLEGATVFLHSNAVPYVIAGKTDATGKAALSTQSYRGVPDGEFKVVVVKEVATPSKYGETAPGGEPKPGEDPEVANARAYEEWTANREKEYRPTHCYVARKYGTEETTDLTVTTSGSSSATLDVGPAVDELFFPEDSATKPTK